MDTLRIVGKKRSRNEIEKQSRLVSFSKRKKALLNKAAELCVLCDAQIACLIFSPSGKITVFGHSDTDTILDSFIKGKVPASPFVSTEQIAREHNKIKDRFKSVKEDVKIQENAGFEFGQWIEDKLDRAQTVDDFTNLMKCLESMKEKFEAKIMNLLSLVAPASNCNFLSTVTEQANNSPDITYSQDFPWSYVSPSPATPALESIAQYNFGAVVPNTSEAMNSSSLVAPASNCNFLSTVTVQAKNSPDITYSQDFLPSYVSPAPATPALESIAQYNFGAVVPNTSEGIYQSYELQRNFVSEYCLDQSPCKININEVAVDKSLDMQFNSSNMTSTCGCDWVSEVAGGDMLANCVYDNNMQYDLAKNAPIQLLSGGTSNDNFDELSAIFACPICHISSGHQW